MKLGGAQILQYKLIEVSFFLYYFVIFLKG